MTRRKSAFCRFLLRPKTLLCLALALFVAAFVIVDACVFPMRSAAALLRMPALPAWERGQMRVLFADVGQGDCTVVQFPDGKTLLIDGGDGSLSACTEAEACCFALGVERFDFALLTHTDADHAEGFAALLDTFGADTVFLPLFPEAEGESGDAYRAALAAAERCGAQTRQAQTYAYFLTEDKELPYYGLFLSPDAGGFYADANDASAVLWLEYAGRSLLCTGDVSQTVERALVQAFEETGGEAFAREVPAFGGQVRLAPDLRSLTVLKAGHHGSAESVGEELLSLCLPEAVVFSAGRGNAYGHPAAETLARVRETVPSAALLRTDEQGSILWAVGADGAYTLAAV